MKVEIVNVYRKMNALVFIMEKSLCRMKFYFEVAKNGSYKIFTSLFYRISLSSQCKNGGWICHDQPISSRTCSIVGLTHLETFDGALLNVKPGHYLLVKVRTPE
jgi:hypothetical protein